MPTGFFSKSTLAKSKPPAYTIPQCGICGIFKHCRSPKMPVTGDGRRGILVVAEYPGEEEDKQNKQLVGSSGQLLRRVLKKHGVDLDRDCWKTNAIICSPDEPPTDKEIEYCRPNVTRTIKDLQPSTIILLGGAAVRSVMKPYWDGDIGGIGKWAGWQIPLRPLNAWVCPTFNPAFLLHSKDDVPAIFFNDHIKGAVALEERPNLPDITKQVRVLMNGDKAAYWLSEVQSRGGPISFDFETNMLKPDSPDARIISCAVCWRGKKTIAFPWNGLAVDAMRALLMSPLPKIAANIKFEQRWSLAKLGCRVTRWVWDTMQQAHVCDNRPGITSVAFQSLVRLGIPSYDSHIKPFLRSKGANIPNQIEEIELRDLLKYNGYDAVCEYFVAKSQVAELGYPLEL